MTIEEIREIIRLVTETGVGEIEVQRGENRVWIKRQASEPPPLPYVTPVAQPVFAPAVPPVTPPAASGTPQTPPSASPPTAEEKLPVITAPIVGTYYEAPSPGAEPFVKVGDTVQPGQVLCIIESMKLMNEIEAETAGVIVAKLVPNGKPVEYGEALFTYRPI
ncbi:MAG: acetyl-CoA carboxylase biotin carboxyl carrier protein [Bryobacteraceae bacterium]|nr:acetyl-CoA carboxylase biotin carboxyl carrier protein [Bryobacteraceae bacterium]MDW8380064.1 acetyl-CoA carboxylase biotin carboxyl carrier protein [Bryobacterales bacterium]